MRACFLVLVTVLILFIGSDVEAMKYELIENWNFEYGDYNWGGNAYIIHGGPAEMGTWRRYDYMQTRVLIPENSSSVELIMDCRYNTVVPPPATIGGQIGYYVIDDNTGQELIRKIYGENEGSMCRMNIDMTYLKGKELRLGLFADDRSSNHPYAPLALLSVDYVSMIADIPIVKTPIYRLYNTKTGTQLYTRGEVDRDKILNKYSDFEFTDGVAAFYASITDDRHTPMYRLYNKKTGAQLYTRGEEDRDKILNKYPDFEFTDGTPAFYASITDDGNTPMFRLYNTKTGMQLYTRGEADRDKILSKYPDYEFTDGVPAFYASLTQ